MLGRSGTIVYYGGVIVVSTLGVMYLRGWKVTDLLYVTRAGLQKSMAGVTTSESCTPEWKHSS